MLRETEQLVHIAESEMTMWRNLLTLENKEQVMNVEIPPCDALTKKFVIKPTEGVNTTTTHPAGDNSSRDRLKMGAPAHETCPVIKQVSDVLNV